MPRPSKVWYREATGWWMVKIAGKQEKLVKGPDDEKHRILAEEKFVEMRKLRRTSPQSADARVADIVEAYLVWSRQHLGEETHRVHLYYGQLFAEHCGQIKAHDIKPFHVTNWIAEMMSPERVERDLARRQELIDSGELEPSKQGRKPKAWGPSTAHNARATAFRVMNWAKEEGIMSVNPLAGMKRPKPAPRQRAMSDEEFDKLYEHASGPFQDFLLALRETGARPKELRDLQWGQVREDRWVLVKHKTAAKVGKPRVIILTEKVKEMMSRLKGNGHTHVFLNCEGGPWTRNAVALQISRLREKLGLADDLCAYLARHGFGTRAIMNGVNPAVVAELMGHNSLEMVSKVYVHLADEHAHLKEAMEKINPSSTPEPAETGQAPKRPLRAKSVKKPQE